MEKKEEARPEGEAKTAACDEQLPAKTVEQAAYPLFDELTKALL